MNTARPRAGRAAGELAFFDEHDVAPARLGQVVEQVDPERTAADDGDPGM